jgi:8-oxo-dGTP pyrophosphatase MutT (NUDIX family)
MQWKKLKEILPGISKAKTAGGQLDGERRKILPYREELLKRIPVDKYRPAAVLVLLYPDNGQTQTVLIERNIYDGVHSGQIAFPGGKKEPVDADLSVTALRETQEELGVDARKINIIRPLSTVKVPISKYEVTPYLGYIDERPVFRPDPSEVQNVLEVPFDFILNETWCVEHKIYEGKSYPVFYLPCNGYKIWGATALVIAELRDLFRKHADF